MVEVDVQLLGGAAVTVFLALLFFGVVVMWDVALALRSVGDKIDKLEDSVDGDLTDINHTLDGISNAPGGGGGGTQLHLSSGTISSGPTAGQTQQPPQAGPSQRDASGPQHQTQSPNQQQAVQQPRQRGADDGERQPAANAVGPRESEFGPEPEPQSDPRRDPATAGVEGSETDESAEQAVDAAAAAAASDVAGHDATNDDGESPDDRDGSESERDDGSSSDAEAGTEPAASASEPGADADADAIAESAHPAAERNRGRFVTSPDRTAWYAVDLDHEALRESEPAIAGELPDGSVSVDDADVIAAGPAGSGDISTESGAIASSVETPADAEPTADAEQSASATATDLESEQSGADAETGPEAFAFDEDGTAVATDTDADPSPDGDETKTESPETAEVAATTAEDDAEDHGEPLEDIEDQDVEEHEDIEPDTALVPDAETGDEDVEPSGEDIVPDDGSSVDTDDESGREPDFEPEAEPSLGGAVTPFEFDAESDDEEISVAEAVETINEDAPAPELSSHTFDVSADVYGREDGSDADTDDALEGETGTEDTVLTFEFEDTVDISGSTKRLLQYQMRSFADQEETPDADVSIGQHRIVIEIHDSDGNAVTRWNEAAVSIIDRTLYLSDNSSEDN
ncbi:hypothetical protein [Natronolimnohabitans innermongolicus]|uniref:ATPase AAA n=1 Tax=Natronolimnohabitans innermongolicus JCM 12255 TaxID=1227499 RepID=L9XN86_9EURY|nr:hypothetical protein [Natronolimnohabitans innermongolicus]ELY62108.1 ATPase AAA [Natronolimnohabitans innermongolicus JCM 12255]